jgi:2-dehydro-3-deoxygalactonokinase
MEANYILCCDWGSTAFRIRVVEKRSVQIVDELADDGGVMAVYGEWEIQSRLQPGLTQTEFFLDRLNSYLKKLHAEAGQKMEKVPLVISGMASSGMGMKELPYCQASFRLDGSNAELRMLDDVTCVANKIILISGVQIRNEVMRGEESQLVGLMDEVPAMSAQEQCLFVLPGTHSKHIYVRGNRIEDLRTHVTGELFSLATSQGSVKTAVDVPKEEAGEKDWEPFLQGVDDTAAMPLLQCLFAVRTNFLLNRWNKRKNFDYLSGVLIGHDLRSIVRGYEGLVYLCSGQKLARHYENAFLRLGWGPKLKIIEPAKLDRATVKGQLKIAAPYLS